MINLNIKKKIKKFWDKNFLGITISLLVFVFFIALFWNRIVIIIDSGEQGIRWSGLQGTELNEIYDEGYKLIFPWDKMYIYNTRFQSNTDTMNILTTEGLSIEIEFYYRFIAIKDSIPVIHAVLGPDYAKTYVDPEIQAASLSIIGNYTPEELYTISTIVVQATIEHYVSKQMIERNIIVDDYLIKKIKLPEIVSQAIQRKIVAQQLNYEFEYTLISAKKEKERKGIEAEGIKNFEEISNMSALNWKGLDVTAEFAKSNNSKIIIMGPGDKDLPLLLNTESK
jgi:regulator of protease activity HflC (stomatin/prohibitin superfamily)